MVSKNKEKIIAFIEYALDTEGMRYRLEYMGNEKWLAVAEERYDAQVREALVRNFNEEWRAYS